MIRMSLGAWRTVAATQILTRMPCAQDSEPRGLLLLPPAHRKRGLRRPGKRAWPLPSIRTDLALPRSPPTGSKKQNGGQGEFGRGAPPTPAVEFRGHCPRPQSKHSAFVPGTPGAAPSPSLARKAAQQVLQPPEARLARSLGPGFLGFSRAHAGSNPA